MSECLGEITEMSAVGAQFFGIEAKMVGVTQRLFKQKLSLFEIASAPKTLYIAKATG